MKDLFNYIITEDSRVEKYLELIKKIGFQKTAEAVGGVDNLFKVIGKNKEIIIQYLLSHFDNLETKGFRNEVHLTQGYTTFLEMSSSFWGGNIKVYDDALSYILKDVPVEMYEEYRRDLLKELISKYDVFKEAERVTVYDDRGLYKILDKFYVNEENNDVIKEDTQMDNIDKKLLNFLTRRIKIQTRKFRKIWDDIEPLEVTEYSFEGYPGYGFTTYDSRKNMETNIIMMLYENDIIDYIYDMDERTPERVKIIKTIRYFLNQILNK